MKYQEIFMKENFLVELMASKFEVMMEMYLWQFRSFFYTVEKNQSRLGIKFSEYFVESKLLTFIKQYYSKLKVREKKHKCRFAFLSFFIIIANLLSYRLQPYFSSMPHRHISLSFLYFGLNYPDNLIYNIGEITSQIPREFVKYPYIQIKKIVVFSTIFTRFLYWLI